MSDSEFEVCVMEPALTIGPEVLALREVEVPSVQCQIVLLAVQTT